MGDTAKEARILYNISHSYLSLTQHEDALKYLQQSLEMTGDRVRERKDERKERRGWVELRMNESY